MRKDYYTIDPDIVKQVALLNVLGFKTYASCQGHGWPTDKIKPYFAFVCDLKDARNMDKIFQEDECSENPKLNWVWKLNACFNNDLVLTWQLRPTYSHKPLAKYLRSSYANDFNTIYKLLRLTFDKGYWIKNIKMPQSSNNTSRNNSYD
ncbi:hypothetical protein [Erwinia billingiae]|uniref:hypothetical protein n=1 Tax=Erwinia billingiae TaxID=182337 RepID=UPI002247FA08|nr:hypothetical protein [Erwinia billingiae]